MKKTSLLLFIALHSVFYGFAADLSPNYPIPDSPDTLRILGVGNSFTDDGMMYLPEVLEAAGIENVVLGRLMIGGCTLERHVKEYENNNPAYIYYKSVDNQWETVKEQATLLDGLADEKWDILVIQQVSGMSGLFESYQPWLNRLIEILRFNSLNAGATIVWQQTWAYATTSTHPDFTNYANNQLVMYEYIMKSNERLVDTTPIDIIIPTGTAIQNLRSLKQNDNDYTRDGFHLDYKMGRYTAACTWFQALIAPAFDTSIQGNKSRLKGTKQELSDEEAEACHLAVRRACARRFALWK